MTAGDGRLSAFVLLMRQRPPPPASQPNSASGTTIRPVVAPVHSASHVGTGSTVGSSIGRCPIAIDDQTATRPSSTRSCSLAAGPAYAETPSRSRAPARESVGSFLDRTLPAGASGTLVAVRGRTVLCRGFGWADRRARVAADCDSVYDVGSIAKIGGVLSALALVSIIAGVNKLRDAREDDANRRA